MHHVSFERLVSTLALPPMPLDDIGNIYNPADTGRVNRPDAIQYYLTAGGRGANDFRYDNWTVNQAVLDNATNDTLPMVLFDEATEHNHLYPASWKQLKLEKPDPNSYTDDDIKRMVLAEHNIATKYEFDHGALYEMNGDLINQNTGRLGSLDHPLMISRIEVSRVDLACTARRACWSVPAFESAVLTARVLPFRTGAAILQQYGPENLILK